ncbi:DNA polymerase III subunit delta' C-terminal domain-containing protein, partial [Francisella tularensis]|uniref:DNA polymerase III subunit delta' C-terminal domain-containing protein n=1 Tax=Francisella tularensis TaxID=263 RepID=UPI0023819AE1
SVQMTRNDINISAKNKLEQHFCQLRNNLMKVLANQVKLNVFLKEANPHFKDTIYWLTSMSIDVYCYKLDEQYQGIANDDNLALINYLAATCDADG